VFSIIGCDQARSLFKFGVSGAIIGTPRRMIYQMQFPLPIYKGENAFHSSDDRALQAVLWK
jgi:hypothetical protein